MRTALIIVAGVVALLLIVWNFVFFTVAQNQQALVLQFGAPVRSVDQPGLGVLIPFVQNVVFFEKRLLDVDVPETEVNLAARRGAQAPADGGEAVSAAAGDDNIRLVVDAFARYRIVDPLKFFQKLRDTTRANAQLQSSISSSLRAVMGGQPLQSVLSEQRVGLMNRIRDDVNARLRDENGIEVVDVRIRRADLPQANSRAVFDQMRANRQRVAAELRAEGQRTATEIRSEADKRAQITVANATRDANLTRGKGDSERNRIFAEAFGRDPAFFEFYRTMQAYSAGITGSDTTMVLSPTSDFFQYFQSGPGSAPLAAPRPAPAPEPAPQ